MRYPIARYLIAITALASFLVLGGPAAFAAGNGNSGESGKVVHSSKYPDLIIKGDTPGVTYPKPPHGFPTNTGIWKAYTPKGVQGAFDNYDPIGLIDGALMKADCSINWRDPKTGKLYCFDSGTSLVYFEQSPQSYIRQAQGAYNELVAKKKATKPGS